MSRAGAFSLFHLLPIRVSLTAIESLDPEVNELLDRSGWSGGAVVR